ncbi:hydrogenase formation protein HypD [Moorella sp. Hama-1]|uniref:hydrogenase formation protein HypD n=1 Tax=Moorella sp. Hama-1 TaxID=2138101 RepID=UPI001F1E212F|nr:hydrogenase formation protein HypD [Moorella sp. Hama-1]
MSRKLARKVFGLADQVAERLGRPAVFMEVCGTHTVSISRMGLRSLLAGRLELRSGPGCPVCVTDHQEIDMMVNLARLPGVTVGTFGDLVRVPGSQSSLERERAGGADVRVFYSPLDAVAFAEANPQKEIVFLGIGFETTIPIVALSLAQARARGVKNFSIFSAHKLVPPAVRALLSDPELKLDGLILPGHVSAVTGRRAFDFIAQEYGLPAVISGFEPLDIMIALHELLSQLLCGEARVVNKYTRVVREEGNPYARDRIAACFAVVDVSWRGLGVIPQSGLLLRETLRDFDARFKLNIELFPPRHPSGCACGEVLRGKLLPLDCRLFGNVCTPVHPVGPCIVSSEGACAAYYRFERSLLIGGGN